jgi:glycosyltransferase involved in cell wall biosynthesis
MKILIVASWFPRADSPFNGVFIAEQARALAREHEVTVLAPEVLPAGAQRLREVEELDGYRCVRLGLPARNLLHHLDYARAIVAEAKAIDAEVIHAHVALPAGFAAVLAGRWIRRPTIITEHRGPFSALMETPRDRFKVRYALERANAVIAVSSALADQMRSYGIERPIRVVPNVVDMDRFRVETPLCLVGAPFRLLFAGILRDHNKNLPLLLRSLARLIDGGGDYRLNVVGDGEVRRECEALAYELGIAENCDFRGALAPDALASEMSKCDLFVLPSRAETFGVVAAEAMAAGRPVVATRSGGPEDFVAPETGLLVPSDDEEAMAGAIREVCEHLDRYRPENISDYARRRFSHQAIAAQLTKIYEEIAGSRVHVTRAAVL